MNVVMAGDGRLIEVQGTAEGTPFSRAHLDELLELAAGGIAEIHALQLRACADGRDRPRHDERRQGARAGPAAGGAASSRWTAGSRPRRTARPSTANALHQGARGARAGAAGGRPWWPTTPGSRWRRSAASPACTARASAAPASTTPGASGTCCAARGVRATGGARFVCVLVAIAPDGDETVGRGRARGHDRRPPRGATAASATTPCSCRTATTAPWPSSRPRRRTRISHRGRAARALAAALERSRRWPRRPGCRSAAGPRRSRWSRWRGLIAVKIVLSAVTGSVAILAEAAHSASILAASIVAALGARGGSGTAGALEGGLVVAARASSCSRRCAASASPSTRSARASPAWRRARWSPASSPATSAAVAREASSRALQGDAASLRATSITSGLVAGNAGPRRADGARRARRARRAGHRAGRRPRRASTSSAPCGPATRASTPRRSPPSLACSRPARRR